MKIYPIQTGTVRIKTNQRRGRGHSLMRQINMFVDREWTEPLPIYAWAIEHPEGVIVVDTGDTARTAKPGYFPTWHPYYRMGVKMNILPEEEIGPQLQKIGIAARDVKQVILTHFHTDHAGGLHHFPGIECLVSEKDYRLASGFAGRLRGYLPHRWPDWFSPRAIPFERESYGPFEQRFPVTSRGDVVIVPTPGHTPFHVSVIVEDEDVLYFLAGDTSYTQQLLLEEQVDGVSPDEAAARQTIQKILRLAEERPVVYLPSHDPESLRRLRRIETIRRFEAVV